MDKRRKEERYEEKVGRKGATKKKERMKEWQRKNDKERMTGRKVEKSVMGFESFSKEVE